MSLSFPIIATIWLRYRRCGVKPYPFLIIQSCIVFMFCTWKFSDWNEENKKWSDKFWPGWDCNLSKDVKKQLSITGIGRGFGIVQVGLTVHQP